MGPTEEQILLMIPVVVMFVALVVFIFLQPRRDRAFYAEAERLERRARVIESFVEADRLDRARLIEQQIGLRNHTEQFRDEQILKEWLG